MKEILQCSKAGNVNRDKKELFLDLFSQKEILDKKQIIMIYNNF
jgi:hypothetical protein